MKSFFSRLRPNVLLICLILGGIVIFDLFNNGDRYIATAAITGLVTVMKDIIDGDKHHEKSNVS